MRVPGFIEIGYNNWLSDECNFANSVGEIYKYL